MARSLQSLMKEYAYPLLTAKEIDLVRENRLNWNGLDAEIIRRKVYKSYPAYCQLTNYGYQMTPYHYSLTANLQRDFEKGPNRGMPYGLILLSASPQTGKSLSVTETFQSWIMIKYPRTKVLTLGYASDFAARFGRRNREKFAEHAPKLSRGKLKLHDKIQSTEEWEIMRLDDYSKTWISTNGGMSTAGMGGVVTGKTGNAVLIDDPIKNMQDADSEVKVANNIEYYQSAVETRLLGNPGSLCIVMCTRWAINDLIGWLRRHRKQYIIGDYNYAALCTDKNAANDPLGRVPGEGICPEMGKDSNWAKIIEQSYTASQGAHVFRALFQGEPSDELGNLYRMDDWGEFEIDKVWKPEELDRVYMSIDATFKNLKTSDYVAIGIGAFKQGNEYKRYIVRKRMDLTETLDMIVKLYKMFPEIDIIYIEDKANGSGIISVLRKWRKKLQLSEDHFPSIYPLEPEGGKYSRAQAASPYQREGRCYLPCEKDAHRFSAPDDFEWEEEGVSYVQCFKQELGTFPYAANDDLVDMHSQVILKNLGILDGTEIVEKPKTRRFTRYSSWWPEMERDYDALHTNEDREAFIKMHGANIKWKPKSEGGAFGVI